MRFFFVFGEVYLAKSLDFQCLEIHSSEMRISELQKYKKIFCRATVLYFYAGILHLSIYSRHFQHSFHARKERVIL